MTFLSLIPPIYTNVKQYGATGNGTTDDTTAIAAAITAAAGGGIVFFPPGNYLVSASLSLSNNNTRLVGSGQATTIFMSTGFSAAQLINITGGACGVTDLNLRGTSTTYSSNPSANCVQITGAVGTLLQNLVISYINGYGVQSSASATVSNDNTNMENVHVYSSAKGFHVLGLAASGNDQVSYINNCNVDLCQNGDCYLIEDAYDLLMTNIFGSCTAGSGSSIHIKGNCTAIYIENVDIGPYPGPSTGAVVLIESGTNGTPSKIGIANGIIEGGTSGIQITAGTSISLTNLEIYNCGTYGINLSGSSDSILVTGCIFNGNGSAGTTGRYDFQSSTTGHVELTNCYFNTAQGSTAGKTNNAINVTAGTHYVQHCAFYGTGYNSGNIFNSYPQVIRNCPGLNPLGSITPPTIGASPYTSPTQSFDYTVFIKGGTVSAISIGGNATGLTVASGGFVTLRIPAQTTVTLTFSAAPTWTWFGD